MSLVTFYKVFSAFSCIGVIATGVHIWVSPETGLQSIGLNAHEFEIQSSTVLMIVACHFAWGVSKYNAYKSGYLAHRRYFRYTLPAMTLWLLAAYSNNHDYILPLCFLPGYIYFGFFCPFESMGLPAVEEYSKKNV